MATQFGPTPRCNARECGPGAWIPADPSVVVAEQYRCEVHSLHFVFVYGTLKRGHYNHGRLAAARFVCDAKTVPGYRLFDVGYYPAMVEDRAGISVYGEIFEVDDETLEDLDRLEGHPHYYRRQPICVEGFDRPVWGYLYTRETRGLRDCAASWERKE
jgi:gamma-glutamylcyclotransferase (GGCT)/AIG2-like uncharacterized protein YtfP